jgi:hypothetical protein
MFSSHVSRRRGADQDGKKRQNGPEAPEYQVHRYPGQRAYLPVPYYPVYAVNDPVNRNKHDKETQQARGLQQKALRTVGKFLPGAGGVQKNDKQGKNKRKQGCRPYI